MRFRINATLSLIIITAFVFFLQSILGDSFTRQFLLNADTVWQRPWILITSMFLHATPSHLFFNMYGLFLFGILLEARIGSKRLLLTYFGTGLIASLLASQFYSNALGASGAVMGVIGTLIILMPDLKLLFFFILPMPLWIAGIIWAAIDAIGLFIPSGIANIAHLAGMGSGLLYGLYLRGKKTEFNRKFTQKKKSSSHMSKKDIDEYLKSGRI